MPIRTMRRRFARTLPFFAALLCSFMEPGAVRAKSASPNNTIAGFAARRKSAEIPLHYHPSLARTQCGVHRDRTPFSEFLPDSKQPIA